MQQHPTLAAHIQQTLRTPQLRQPTLVENAMGRLWGSKSRPELLTWVIGCSAV
jgi:hypothetical protein